MSNLIGFMGYAGAGKTTAATYLRETYGFVTPHIGRPLKRMLATLLREFEIPEDRIARYIDGDLKRDLIPELGVTSTEAQQSLGTAWGRECVRPDLWLDLWGRQVDKTLAAGGRATSESVRFGNEAAAIRTRGGLIVEIHRPGVGAVNGHVSEERPCEPDIVVWNDGPPAVLHARLDGLLARTAAAA